MFRLATRTRGLASMARNMCSAVAPPKPLVLTEMDSETGYATVTLNRAPVNGLSLELMTAVGNTIDELEREKARGMILTTAFPNKVFCAGLELTEMVNPDPERFRVFWTSLQDMWKKLYGSSFPTVAVVSGHAPAGGCLLAVACEYRVMMPEFTIGLNETVLGLMVPQWLQTTLSKLIGPRLSELACTTGKLFSAEDALDMGMVDELVESHEEGIASAVEFLDTFKNMLQVTRNRTKLSLRNGDIERFHSYRRQELEFVASHVMTPEFQNGLVGYLEALKNRKAKRS